MIWNDLPLKRHLKLLPARDDVLRLCSKWRVQSLDYFGSILTDRFNPSSDIDLLIAFEKGVRWSLFDHAQMEEEFSALFGRRVELVSKRAIEASKNPYRKQEILGHRQEFYAA